MPTEIERKYMVSGDFTREAEIRYFLMQGYLYADEKKSIRVRIREDRAWLTIKGKPQQGGLQRFEWDKEIRREEAELLLPLCDEPPIEKYRYLIPAGKHTWEVDVFLGANEGLVIAEIELSEAGETFSRPSWLGEEVTGDKRYYNAHLIKKPYRSW